MSVVVAVRSDAANLAFPGDWTNPLTPATFEDWHFDVCDGSYVAGSAHLGADSQAYPANTGPQVGKTVVMMAPGTVRGFSDNWPGDAVGVEHLAAHGARFVAVYGHIVKNPLLVLDVAYPAGTAVGTVFDQGGNSHLHLGVRPLAEGEDPHVRLKGLTSCSDGAPAYGFVDPLPYLDQHNPAASPTLAAHRPVERGVGRSASSALWLLLGLGVLGATSIALFGRRRAVSSHPD